jgi:APA family basic amino acid/polyamine antiporter/amino acid efflux transporter
MLQRNISLTAGISIAISMVVGSGLFALPGLAIEATDPITALLGWIVVIALMPPMIHIFSFLGRKFPQAGGITLYASHAIGKWSEAGFSLIICGALAVGMPAFFMVGGAYLTELLHLDTDVWHIPIAIGLAIASTLMNLAGVNRFTLINKLAVVVVLCIVILLVALSLPSPEIVKMQLSQVMAQNVGGFGQIWLAASIVFWAFQGWENMSFGLEEFENPDRSIPIVFWLSFGFISLIYLIFALVATSASMSGYEVIGLTGVTSMMGKGILREVLLVVTVIVLIANANSWVFGASRAFYSASDRGYLPNSLSIINKNKLPKNSLLATLCIYVVVIVGIWVMNLDIKFAFLLTTQGFIILYGASILAYWKLTSGLGARLIAILALGSWMFFMHGFGALILYPLTLFVIGIVVFWRKNDKQLLNSVSR